MNNTSKASLLIIIYVCIFITCKIGNVLVVLDKNL